MPDAEVERSRSVLCCLERLRERRIVVALFGSGMTLPLTAAVLAMMVVAICAQSPAQARPEVPPAPVRAASTDRSSSYDVHGTWSQFRPPDGAVNLALKTGGAWATASSTADGFDPNGALDGVWTVQGWGKGHGWQNAKRHEYPSWLEVHLPREEEIDTIVIQTFPEVVRGMNWMGIRNADVQVKFNGRWEALGDPTTVRGNVRGTIVLPFQPLRTDAIRIFVLGANTGQQEDAMYDDDDFARILQVGLYRLNIPYPFVEEDVTVRVDRGQQGNIAIYRDQLPVKPGKPSSPEYLASLFRKAGYGVTFLDSKALCVPEIFNRKNFDVFVQPYGAPFPVGTLLFQFLGSGGHLITLGGHPFRRALMFSPEGRLVDGGYDPGITTTVARQSDYKLPFREQLGMFYTGYERFEDVAYVKPASDQNVVKSNFKVNAHLEGEVAAALVGERLPLEEGERLTEEGIFPTYANTARKGLSNIVGMFNNAPGGGVYDYLSGYIFNWPRARWIPLVNAYDRVGRLRGSVISLLANFRGPYRGSGWIFCGVENEDLFSTQHPEFTQALLDGLQYLHFGLGLHDVLPEMDCYYQGEAVKVAASVENYEVVSRRVSLNFQLISSGSTSPVFEKRLDIVIEPGGKQRPSVSWKPQHFDSDLYRIRVSLFEGDRQIDTAESAFVVWDPKIIAQGPEVDFHANYFHTRGRAELLIGSRTMGLQPHGQADEDVLAWDRQFAQMRQYGVKVLSPVLGDSYIPGLAWGKPGTPAVPLQAQRLMDAQVQLAQKHHLIFGPVLFWPTKHMAMMQPEFSRRLCEELGKRYASVPGIIFYIFDDGVPYTRLQSFQDWTKNCVEGLYSSGRKYVVLGETGGVALQRYGSEAMTMPANGNFSPGHPALYRAMDMRAAGNSFHLSEFGLNSPGAQPSDIDLHTYPGEDVSGSPTGDYSVYLMEPHLVFGTGGSYLVNDVPRDTTHLIFTWGVTNPNDYTPSKPLIAYRNESYFLRHFQPTFHFPKVLIVFSKAHLMKDEESFVPYLYGTLNALFEYAVQYAVIDDVDLDRIPSGPHVLIYPDPRYASPEILSKLRSRVEAGDDLFLTGDFTQPLEAGGSRQIELFNQFVGLKWLSDYPAGSEIPIVPARIAELLNPYIGHPLSMFQSDGAGVLATDSQGHALLATHKLGGGHVFFTSDASLDGTQRALNVFLKMRAVPSTALSPKMPNRFIFEIDRADGGKVYTLAATNPGSCFNFHCPDSDGSSHNGPWIERPENYAVNIGNERIDLPLGGYGVSLFAVRSDGSIDALEGQGRFGVDGTVMVDARPHVMTMSLDDVALTKSHAIAMFPIGAGQISIAAPSDVDLVEVGEPGADQFHPLEEIATSRQEGRLTFQIDDVQSRGVLLITSKTNRDYARQLMNAALQ